MAKSTMGAKVDKLEFKKLGIEIDIRFDKSNGKFNGEFQGKTYTNESITVLKNILTDAVNESTEVLWQDILHVRFNHTSDNDGGVGFMLNVKRFRAYLNPNPTNANRPWMRCDWDAPEDKRMGWARPEDRMIRATLPIVRAPAYGEKNSEVYMEYNEELYQQLVIARDGLQHFRYAMQKPILAAENLPLLSITLQRFMSALQVMYPISDPPEKKDASEV